MLCQLQAASEAEARALIADPSDIQLFLSGYALEPTKSGWWVRLSGRSAAPAPVRSWDEPSTNDCLDLDESWHVLHYIFSRDPWAGELPQATLLRGGRELGDIDVGYGPARIYAPQELREFSAFLATLTQHNFLDDVSASGLHDSDIDGVCHNEDTADLEPLWDYIADLRGFLGEVIARNRWVILHLY